jgi:hypothetical protein
MFPFLSLPFFVVYNQAFGSDKGLDDLLVDKLGVVVARNYSFDVENCKHVVNDVKGNYLFVLFCCIDFPLFFACFIIFLCDVGMHVISTPAPVISTAEPIIGAGSATPRTSLRTVRIRHPLKVLLPPYSFISTTEDEDMLYNKVIIHHIKETRSKIREYGSQLLMCFFSILFTWIPFIIHTG